MAGDRYGLQHVAMWARINVLIGGRLTVASPGLRLLAGVVVMRLDRREASPCPEGEHQPGRLQILGGDCAAGRGPGARLHTRGLQENPRSLACGVLAFELKACLCGFAVIGRRRFGACSPGVFIGFTCVRCGSIA
jgi:hypothetical protein